MQERIPDHRVPSCLRPSTSELSILVSYSEYSLSRDATALLVRRIRANVHRLGRSALETMLEVDWNVTEDYLPETRYNGSPSSVGTENVAACFREAFL